MYCGGNQLVDMGLLRAESVSGSVADPAGSAIPRARIQVQIQGDERILHDIVANEKGKFHLMSLRPGVYWLGISSPGFNLHFWELRVLRDAGAKTMRVKLSLGT